MLPLNSLLNSEYVLVVSQRLPLWELFSVLTEISNPLFSVCALREQNLQSISGRDRHFIRFQNLTLGDQQLLIFMCAFSCYCSSTLSRFFMELFIVTLSKTAGYK